jgi:hypothetical protein
MRAVKYVKKFGNWEFHALACRENLQQWEILPRLRVQSLRYAPCDRNLGVGFGWLVFWLHVSFSRVAS